MSTDEQTKRSSWRQFSLREILLAMTAIAALLALYRQTALPRTTDFAKGLDVKALIEDTGKQQGLTPRELLMSGGQGGASSDHGASLEAAYSFAYLPDPSDLYTKLMPALRLDIRERLTGEGCSIEGVSQTGNNQFKELTAWAFSYRLDRIRGKVRAHTSFDESGNPELRIMIDEW